MPPTLPKDIKYNPNAQVTAHFKAYELECPHCHVLPTIEFCRMLETLRIIYGGAIITSSVYRCPIHNKDVGGSIWSPHKLREEGKPYGAADIKIPQRQKRKRFLLLRAIYKLGFNMVEIADKHIHAAIVPENHPMYMKHYSGFKSK